MSTIGTKAQIGSNADPSKNVVMETMTDGTLLIRAGSLNTPGTTLATISPNGVFKSTSTLNFSANVATTSGAFKDLPVPTWAKRVTLLFNFVATNGSSDLIVQTGGGGVLATNPIGISSIFTTVTTGVSWGAGIRVRGNGPNASTADYSGRISFILIDPIAKVWMIEGQNSLRDGGVQVGSNIQTGSVVLPNGFDQLRITTTGGTDLLRLGSAIVLAEG